LENSTAGCLTLLISKPAQMSAKQCYYQNQHKWSFNTDKIEKNTKECLTLLNQNQDKWLFTTFNFNQA